MLTKIVVHFLLKIWVVFAHMHEFFCVDILCVSKIDDITELNKMKLKKLFLMVKYWAQNRRQKTFALFKQQ